MALGVRGLIPAADTVATEYRDLRRARPRVWNASRMTTQSERVDAYAETGRYHRPWYWYDWANSAFVTTVGTVLFGPVPHHGGQGGRLPGHRLRRQVRHRPLRRARRRRACRAGSPASPSSRSSPLLVLLVLGVVAYARGTRVLVRPTALIVPLPSRRSSLVLTAPLDPGSIAPYTITLATIMSALLLIMVGAIADRSPAPGPAPRPVRLGRLGRGRRPVLPRRQQLAASARR